MKMLAASLAFVALCALTGFLFYTHHPVAGAFTIVAIFCFRYEGKA